MTTREQIWATRSRPGGSVAALASWLGLTHRTRASVLGSIDALTIRVGCSAPNRAADRAGRYRRLAVALALLPVPLVGMGSVVVRGESASLRFGAVHLALAGACLWLAVDLVRRASVLDGRDLPLASVAAVLVGLALLADFRPTGSAARFGPPEAVVPALVGVAIAFVALVLAERHADRLLSILGRWILAAGVAMLGAVELAQTVAVYPDSRTYAVGLGATALLLVMLAYFETRVLLRGVALVRLLSRR